MIQSERPTIVANRFNNFVVVDANSQTSMWDETMPEELTSFLHPNLFEEIIRELNDSIRLYKRWMSFFLFLLLVICPIFMIMKVVAEMEHAEKIVVIIGSIGWLGCLVTTVWLHPLKLRLKKLKENYLKDAMELYDERTGDRYLTFDKRILESLGLVHVSSLDGITGEKDKHDKNLKDSKYSMHDDEEEGTKTTTSLEMKPITKDKKQGSFPFNAKNRTMAVVVPFHALPGQEITFKTPEGEEVNVIVPIDCEPGGLMNITY